VIPNPDQLKAIANLKRGSLAETPFPVLLHALAVHRRSVTLELERPPLEKSIILEQGHPVDCRSNMVHETLSRFMESRGDLTPEEAQELLNKAAARGVQFGEMMILEGRITASELYRILQQNLAKKLLDCFAWRSGDFRIHDEQPEVESPLQVNTPQLLVTGISKFAVDEEVNAAIGPLVGKTLRIHPEPPFPLRDIRLSVNQRRLTELMQPGKRIDELAAETTIPFNEIMRLLYSLAVIGAVVPEEWLPKDAAPAEPPGVEMETESPEPATEPPATAVPGTSTAVPGTSTAVPGTSTTGAATAEAPASVPSPAEVEKERDALMETYLKHRKQDPFDLLGLDEDAAVVEIEDAYLDFSRRFAPWRFAEIGLGELREKARELFLAGGRAFGELGDAEQRNSLVIRRRNLREKRKRKPARDRFVIKSELLDPEVQFKKGKALMGAGKHREALQQLQFACDCDPQNGEYRAELAYCRFLAHPGDGKKALEELRETLRLDPESGLAVYYSGMILGELEDYVAAEEHLRRAIKMMMPDRRPIEGLKELQAKQKKSRKKLRLL